MVSETRCKTAMVRCTSERFSSPPSTDQECNMPDTVSVAQSRVRVRFRAASFYC